MRPLSAGNATPIRAVLAVIAITALAMALASSAGARPQRFEGYVGGAATGKGTNFYVGDGLNLVFRDSYRSYTRYRVCWTRGAGRRCWSGETGSRKVRDKIFTAAPSSVGTYNVTWYVGGKAVASWSFYNNVGD